MFVVEGVVFGDPADRLALARCDIAQPLRDLMHHKKIDPSDESRTSNILYEMFSCRMRGAVGKC